MRNESARDVEKSMGPQIGVFVGALAVAAALTLGGVSASKDGVSKAEEIAAEACVTKLAGYEVDLAPNQDGSALQWPHGLAEEVYACTSNDNDPVLAEIDLRN